MYDRCFYLTNNQHENMKWDNLSYHQVFQTFGIQPVYESSCCYLFKEHKRHFCVYHDKDSGKIQCLYINALEHINQSGLFSLLSPYHDFQFVSLEETGNEYPFKEKVTSDFIIKWCYSIRKIDLGDDVPDIVRDIVAIFDKSKDIFMDENNHIKLVIRDRNGIIADLLEYRDNDFEATFSNSFGSWDDRPDTSSLLHHLYTTNPYLLPPFFEENNQYHYHIHAVPGYQFPEFTNMFMQLALDEDTSLEPSFFLLNSLKDYIGFIRFLCHYATVKSKKNFFNFYQYTDHIVLEIIPSDSPLGHTGLTYKSWQTMFSQKLGEDIHLNKWQTGSGIYTGIPQKIDILHQLCLDFIHLNKLTIRVINHVLDVDTSDEQEQFNDSYHEQIF